MAEAFAALVERVVARLQPLPIVSPEEYRAIGCNRCGLCCEDIRGRHTPEQMRAWLEAPDTDEDRRRFLSGLEPVEPVAGGWRYRCRHFRRDAGGLGECTIHASRPLICSGYPYGRTVRQWTQCAWYVEVRDAAGKVVEVVEPQEPAAGLSHSPAEASFTASRSNDPNFKLNE
ncbi:MAG TPA: YkgJ family cysteine cluster protein [Dehalococcoidia bacterium]|nr:YkgJ family cysteine cluster protein [Dehalococcoidia bacterium]